MADLSRACNWSRSGVGLPHTAGTRVDHGGLLTSELRLEDCIGTIGVKIRKVFPTGNSTHVKLRGLREGVFAQENVSMSGWWGAGRRAWGLRHMAGRGPQSVMKEPEGQVNILGLILDYLDATGRAKYSLTWPHCIWGRSFGCRAACLEGPGWSRHLGSLSSLTPPFLDPMPLPAPEAFGPTPS